MGKLCRGMAAYLAPYQAWFWAGQAAMLLATAAGLAFPWAVRGVFNALFQAGSRQTLWVMVGVLALVSVVRELTQYVKNHALGHLGQSIIRDLRARVYERLLQLSLGFYDSQTSGDITSSLTNDMNLLQQSISSGLTYILQQAITLVAVTVLLLRIDAVLTLSIFAMLPVVMLISKRMGDRIRGIAESTQERLGYLFEIITQSISGMMVIQAFVLESRALGLFREANDRILGTSLQSLKVQNSTSLAIGLLNAVFLLLVIGLGAYRVTVGALSPADLIAFILYSEMVAGPVSVLAGVYLEVNRATAAYQRIAAILEAPRELRDGSVQLLQEQVRGQIEFNDVTFSYDGHRPVLQAINLSVKPGETVALVGPSGAGKSTLVKLLPRFYDLDGGTIRLDGVDIRALALQSLRQQIAVVPQDTYLFGMTIRDNIACGRPAASDAEIVRAAQLANAHDFILEQEQGYETQVGERGARLSGGQRQRLAIARAFLKDPRILILDEATSALDTHAERQVQQALETLMCGRTTFVIAHRLSTIVNADKIAVFREGRIVATGPHRELLERCPLYSDLYRQQFGTHAVAGPGSAQAVRAGSSG